MLKAKDWIGPVLAILIPVSCAFVHLEMGLARLEAAMAGLEYRVERIERTLDARARSAQNED